MKELLVCLLAALCLLAACAVAEGFDTPKDIAQSYIDLCANALNSMPGLPECREAFPALIEELAGFLDPDCDVAMNLGQAAEAREIRFSIEGDDYRAYGENVLKEFRTFAKEQPLFHIVEPNYEGVRVSFHDSEVKGWALLRMSLHDPQMPMNLEAEAKGGTDIIWKRMEPFFGRFPRLTR